MYCTIDVATTRKVIHKSTLYKFTLNLNKRAASATRLCCANLKSSKFLQKFIQLLQIYSKTFFKQ